MRLARSATWTVLLIVLTVCVAGAILIATPGTLARAIGGIALLLVLPWIAASRLPSIRHADTLGSRLSVAGSLGIAVTVLLGLFFLLTPLGLGTLDLIVTTLLVIIVFALGGLRADQSTSTRPHFALVGIALIVVALGGTVAAFLVARHGALVQASRNRSYATFIVRRQGSLDIGLRNPTDHPAQFAVHIVEGKRIGESTIIVPRAGLRLIPAPTPRAKLTTVHHTAAGEAGTLKIRVKVTVSGRQRGPVLSLFYVPAQARHIVLGG